MRLAGRILGSLLVLSGTGWGTLALYHHVPPVPYGVPAVCMFWALSGAAALVLLWRGRAARALQAWGVAFAMLVVWWARLAPSDTRDWADDVARHLQSRVEGGTVTLSNVRNFDWRSDEAYTARWETRRVDLDRLRTVDMALSYWMGPAIAHTLVSFGFDNGEGGVQQIVFSIEIRKERGESFSAIAGFFKQYELGLVAADERDILRVRTNVRGEDVYLYRVQLAPAAQRALFLAYLAEADALAREPRFYDTLTANCTTIVYEMVRRIVGGLPLDWRLLASGYLPEYLHGVGGLVPGHTVEELRSAGRITDRAQAADVDPRFSQAIRQGVPGMEATP